MTNPPPPGYGPPTGEPEPPGHPTPPGHTPPSGQTPPQPAPPGQPWGSQPVPPGHPVPPGYAAPSPGQVPGYGQPPGYAAPPQGQVPGYGQPPGYAATPPGYPTPPQGQAPGYGQPPGYAATPPGYPVPPGQGAGYGQPPTRVVSRIPEDEPFLVYASATKRAGQFGLLLLVLALLLGCPLGLAASQGGGVLVAIIGIGAFVVLFGGLMALQVYLLTSGGPILALNQQGLWIKTRPTRGQAIWVPWELVGRIYRRRWSLEKNLCVQPRDPRVGSNLGAFTALDASMQQLVFGSGLTASLNFASRSESEIMAAVVAYAAGRCRIE